MTRAKHPSSLLRQKAVRGVHREKRTAYVDRIIDTWIEREAARFHCTRSLVVRNAIADAAGILVDRYLPTSRSRLRVVRRG